MKARQTLLAGLLSISALSATLVAGEFTVKLDLHGEAVQGTVLAANSQFVHLLARDGRLWKFPPAEARNFSQVAATFRPLSAAEMRAQLQREFGSLFDVSGTGHYLVVHQAGERDLWAERFEELYRNFQHYFTACGLSPQTPRFPLVAVVFPRQVDFLEQARREGVALGPGLLGYYSPTTNRVLLYDETNGAGAAKGQWYRNAETIIHEATHQTAFNTGMHSRYAMPPRWVCEGLATLFEARGVWDSGFGAKRESRVNQNQLAAFRQYLARRPQNGLAEFISSDRLYQTETAAAYGAGWALTFFLAETEPRKYGQYLAKTANLPPFVPYASAQRLKDFREIFGENLPLFEARWLRFMEELR